GKDMPTASSVSATGAIFKGLGELIFLFFSTTYTKGSELVSIPFDLNFGLPHAFSFTKKVAERELG
ncbi:hypothetical protein, partial [Bacteroides heparinolyticus]|uniref:hypothetical protein n=1 Tax=Prevotella heparinolytica TaxID=28113 RepID=UPI0035A1AA8C